MKTVNLTASEIDVILTSLNVHKICESNCYCSYKSNMCDKKDKEGNPRCQLKKLINSIENKLDN